jgi:hypothetical protein
MKISQILSLAIRTVKELRGFECDAAVPTNEGPLFRERRFGVAARAGAAGPGTTLQVLNLAFSRNQKIIESLFGRFLYDDHFSSELEWATEADLVSLSRYAANQPSVRPGDLLVFLANHMHRKA